MMVSSALEIREARGTNSRVGSAAGRTTRAGLVQIRRRCVRRGRAADGSTAGLCGGRLGGFGSSPCGGGSIATLFDAELFGARLVPPVKLLVRDVAFDAVGIRRVGRCSGNPARESSTHQAWNSRKPFGLCLAMSWSIESGITTSASMSCSWADCEWGCQRLPVSQRAPGNPAHLFTQVEQLGEEGIGCFWSGGGTRDRI